MNQVAASEVRDLVERFERDQTSAAAQEQLFELDLTGALLDEFATSYPGRHIVAHSVLLDLRVEASGLSLSDAAHAEEDAEEHKVWLEEVHPVETTMPEVPFSPLLNIYAISSEQLAKLLEKDFHCNYSQTRGDN